MNKLLKITELAIKYPEKGQIFVPTIIGNLPPLMANDDDKTEHLLQHFTSPRTNPPPSLIRLPEHNEVTLSDRLIFGLSTPHRDSSLLIDSLFQNPSPSSSLLLPHPEHKSTHHGLQRSNTAPAMVAISNDLLYHRIDPRTESSDSLFAVAISNDLLYHRIDPRTESSDSIFAVKEVAALLIVYLSLSLIIYWLNRDDYIVNQTHPFVDALYFCIVTISTIGYGDITPDSVTTKLFSIMFVLVGFGFMGLLLNQVVTFVLLRNNSKLEAPNKGMMMKIWLKLGLALGLVVLCLGFGVLIIHFIEKIGWLDSFYHSVVSVTTVGYGARAFNTLPGRLLAAIWLLLSTFAVAQVFLYSSEKRNRERAIRVLCEPMTISQFIAANINNNGRMSKAEFVIYKLKMMEKITDYDINQIVNHFDKLDRTNTGSITLMDLQHD